MIRMSILLPEKLLKEFDEVLNNRSYKSRSKESEITQRYIIRY